MSMNRARVAFALRRASPPTYESASMAAGPMVCVDSILSFAENRVSEIVNQKPARLFASAVGSRVKRWRLRCFQSFLLCLVHFENAEQVSQLENRSRRFGESVQCETRLEIARNLQSFD